MKILHTKNAGKSEEQLIIDTLSKQLRESFKKFLGETQINQDLDKLNNLTKDVLKKIASQPITYLTGYYAAVKCLTCGSNCPKGDCQLGSE
jgi:hypothetical protein